MSRKYLDINSIYKNKQENHQLYINKTDDINKIDFQTKKLIELRE
jgi:hypothetical protein